MFRLTSSSLYDQSTFYDRFYKDLRSAKRRVVIESPFITQRRSTPLFTTISKLKKRRVEVIVNTKPIEEHDSQHQDQVAAVVEMLQDLGVRVLFTNGHHRKIAIIDDILYEGSLNILSQNDSCELMRRIDDASSVREMLRFIRLEKWCK
jgi:phosphatidylserine/phosphatidylglycerophosphate/cardiolipin synthase-like enzyme